MASASAAPRERFIHGMSQIVLSPSRPPLSPLLSRCRAIQLLLVVLKIPRHKAWLRTAGVQTAASFEFCSSPTLLSRRSKSRAKLRGEGAGARKCSTVDVFDEPRLWALVGVSHCHPRADKISIDIQLTYHQ